MPRKNNFFAEYGLLMHECYEKYFLGELDAFDLSEFYRSNFNNFVKSDAPPYVSIDKYRDEGQNYFDNFSFDRDFYDVLIVEDKIDFDLGGINFTARPDLVLQEKESRDIILVDYKSSTPIRTDKRSGKEITDNKKIEGYEKQLYMYAHALRNHRNMPIKRMKIWFPRINREVGFLWTQERETEILNWMHNIIDTIKTTNEFPYNNSSPFFCNHLCSVSEFCEYKQEI